MSTLPYAWYSVDRALTPTLSVPITADPAGAGLTIQPTAPTSGDLLTKLQRAASAAASLQAIQSVYSIFEDQFAQTSSEEVSSTRRGIQQKYRDLLEWECRKDRSLKKDE